MKSAETEPQAGVSPPSTLAFAGYRLDCRNRRLSGPDGRDIPISARAFDTLRCLALNPHALLTRQQLMREIWPNSVVDHNNLDQQISAVRRLLGDDGSGQRFIITVTGQGFRFVQDVARVFVPTKSRRWFGASPGILLAGVALVAMVALLAGDGFKSGSSTRHRANADYLAARALIRSSGSTQVRQAIDLLEKAVRRDPGFAPAWAALAEGYTFAADFPAASALPLSPVELQQRVTSAALRAFELAPDAPETLRSAGMVSMQNRNWSEAEQRLKRALELAGPADYEANLQYAWFLMNVGRAREAVPYEERAMRVEPSLMRPVALRAALYEMQGDLGSAESLLLSRTKLQEHDPLRRQGLFMLRMARHDHCTAQRGIAVDGLPCPLLADPKRTLSEIRLNYEAAAANGHTGQLFAQAQFAAFLGDAKLALDMLEIWSRGTTQNLHVIWRPVMSEVRAQPGFDNLLRKLGLVDYWRATGNWGDFCRPLGEDSFTCRAQTLSVAGT